MLPFATVFAINSNLEVMGGLLNTPLRTQKTVGLFEVLPVFSKLGVFDSILSIGRAISNG
jgi:hypothetical protein